MAITTHCATADANQPNAGVSPANLQAYEVLPMGAPTCQCCKFGSDENWNAPHRSCPEWSPLHSPASLKAKAQEDGVSLQAKVELQAMCSWQEPGHSHSYSHDARLLDTTVPSP